MKILVTGVAGFIGFHLAKRLLDRGDEVVGVDIVNDYYDIDLKEARLSVLHSYPCFTFHRENLADWTVVSHIFSISHCQKVVHLAAQAGVRYSLTHPHFYIESNVTATLNMLEGCRHYGTEHFVFASSSSVYGSNKLMPFSAEKPVDHPVSLYAASKKACEMMAHSYAHLYGIPCTGLRFFSVYGPFGRPDMALFQFTRNIAAGLPIDVYNNGEMRRDFTYVDDIIAGIINVLEVVPKMDSSGVAYDENPSRSHAPYRIFNIGNDCPVRLMDFIKCIEKELGKKAVMNLMPIQPGDVPASWADVTPLKEATGFAPQTPIDVGVNRFVSWYKEFYGI